MGLYNDEHAVNQEICRLLDSFAHFGVQLGLESTQALLSYLGNPHHQVAVIHVAGTNGKGSVCAYLSTILTEAGYRVGRYTSPHLLDWNERICINNQPISASSLLETVRTVQSTIDLHHLDGTQFEVITATAWLYFAVQQVDIAVMEVGLGGRLDATNVCDRPLSTIITSIGRDHWQQLGDTLGEIAAEKAGILKPHSPAIIGPVPPEAEAAIVQRLQDLNCPTVWVPPAQCLGQGQLQYRPPSQVPLRMDVQDASVSTSEQSVSKSLASSSRDNSRENSTPPLTYALRLKGPHQRINSALAIATIHTLQNQGWAITTEHIRQGLATTEWPGRLQWITWHGQKILLDGAHNTAAAIALRDYVDTLPQPIHWIIGMLETKDHQGILKVLLNQGDRLSLVPVPDSNTALPHQLATIAQACCAPLATCHIYNDVVTVLNTVSVHGPSSSIQNAPNPDCFKDQEKTGSLVLCGSLYLIGYVLRQLKNQNLIRSQF